MLPVFAQAAELPVPRLLKKWRGRDASLSGAFPRGAKIEYELQVPRTLAAAGAVLRLWRDTQGEGEEALDASPRDYPFAFVSTDCVTDVYRLTLDTAALCGGTDSGLFYYELFFPRGMDTVFSDTGDNVHFALTGASARRFRLLVYEKDFAAPSVGNGIMYHVFVDRFCRGDGPVCYRDDAVLHADWDTEMPEYAPMRGDFVANRDFFGGNLRGVAEKLPYLSALGVTVLYLSPVFDSPSNHKYDTSDYTQIDAGFGGTEAFENLLRQARACGMRVILDGVFNHTGSDSRYFDREGKYGPSASDPASPYHGWYRFDAAYKHGYECWWDIDILPRMRTDYAPCRDYFTAPGGICARYARLGCGWRLDVADELPDAFLSQLRQSVKAVNPDALIIGEVWENAADKVAYGKRRKYFRGGQLDSVMNYPLRTALLRFGAYGDAAGLADTLTELYSSYPKSVCDALMNVIGTHDTYRALTYLGSPARAEKLSGERDNSVLAAEKLSDGEYALGVARLKAISVLQYTVYGFPCVYYGDETGMEGMGDPFCRKPMRWGARADADLLAHYRRLGEVRRREPVFDGGDFRVLSAADGCLVFSREKGKDRVTVAVNCGPRPQILPLCGRELCTGETLRGETVLPPQGFAIVKEK